MFLSLLDDRARPKGSRDPLGFEMVWTHFGRRVVGNLTTITSSWKIFAVGLLGFHWSNQLCRDLNPVDRQKVLQQHFLRYEQLAAYLRSSANDHEIMGITRVRKRLGDDRKTISIGTDQKSLILSDQVSYGIWGLYSTALRETGLVRGDLRELTETGLEIVGLIENNLIRQGEGLGMNWYFDFLRGQRKAVAIADLERENMRFVRAISADKVRDALIAALLRGSGKHHCQLALYDTCRALDLSVLKEAGMGTLVAKLGLQTKSPELRQALENVSQIERLLVLANALFNYLRRQDDEPLEAMASAIDLIYRFDHLPAGPDLTGVPYGSDLEALRVRLRSGDTLASLRCLLDMNKKIMTGRGGAAWVEESSSGRLRVRVKAETAHLPPIEELQTHWDYDYFLRSYARIAAQERR
ncbi:hypothetical protein LOKO_01477 [Halomonas chromatireducens]|uniref:Uncharacterized protein n=2 Tax=Halomonas chromatireducens TaxID=507626 RepID=A0A0X8HDK4_9GAMM|nr:hypothetical protein LOKO_01477 [Halomonas chromatireducens]